MKITIINAYIIDPSQDLEGDGTLVSENGRITELFIEDTAGSQIARESSAPERQKEGDILIDAKGLYVFPGFIDMGVHLKVPGFENNETMATGTRAALLGGFTSLCCLPDTLPVNDNDTQTRSIFAKASEEALCHVYPIGAVTHAMAGKQLAEMGLMHQAGCLAFSDVHQDLDNCMLLRRALEYTKPLNVPLITYPQDKSLAAKGGMNEGVMSTRLGLRGVPREAEIIAIKRNIDLIALTHGRMHIASVSTKEGVDAIMEAKKAGFSITASTCPHYFTLTEEILSDYNTSAKVTPPLRTQTDIAAIKKGLAEGVIDAISSDHHPHCHSEKCVEFDEAPYGISGLETAFGLCFTLVQNGVLTLSQLTEKMALMPARILNLAKGTLKIGADADIVLIDPRHHWVVQPDQFASKGKTSPFVGMPLVGKPVKAIVKGELIDFVS